MKALMYNDDNNKIVLSDISNAIRLAYLFISSGAITGDTGGFMHFKRDFSNLSLQKKLAVAIKFYISIEYFEFAQELIKFEPIVKQHINTKHHDTKTIIAFKAIEKMINTVTDQYIEYINNGAALQGFLEIKELIEDDVLGYMQMKEEDNLHFKNKKNDLLDTFDFLQFELDESESDNSFILTTTGAFLNKEYNNAPLYNSTDIEAIDESSLFLDHCLTIPSPAIFKAVEMKAIRKNILQHAAVFNEIADQWFELFKKADATAERLVLINNELLPSLKLLQEKINENDLLNYAKHSTPEQYIKVWIGEAPLAILWDYYFKTSIINELVYNKLMDEKCYNSKLNRRIPIMVFETIGGKKIVPKIPEITAEESDIHSIRKTISIND